MTAPNSTVQISKIVAAQRQLDAAIRMFFGREDELAIHTVAAAAFQVLRDLIKNQGGHFTKEALHKGIWSIARQCADGTLRPETKAIFEGSNLLQAIAPLVDDIRDQGDRFDFKRIDVQPSKQLEHKLWLSPATTFLKHADRDANDSLTSDHLDNEKILMATCAAYLEITRIPTLEIAAYCAYWSVKNQGIDGLAADIKPFALELNAANEATRHELCSAYIRENKQSA